MTVGIFDVAVEITPAMVKFNRLAGRFSNFIPLSGGRLDVAVRDFLKRRFESEGRVGGGGRWVQLSPSYREFKKAKVGSKKLLQFRGSMMDAFTKKGAPHQILNLTPTSYELTVDESTQRKARSHQWGNPDTHLPARVIVPPTLPNNFIDQLRRVVMSYATGVT